MSIILGDSKWSWISMATMYENLCGNGVGGVELTFVWHFISVHLIFFIPLHVDLTILKIARLWSVKEMSTLSRVATYIFVHSCHTYLQSFWINQYVQSWAINFSRPCHSLTQSKKLHCKTVVNIITYHHAIFSPFSTLRWHGHNQAGTFFKFVTI
jgi:hypothetical protein